MRGVMVLEDSGVMRSGMAQSAGYSFFESLQHRQNKTPLDDVLTDTI